MYDIPRFAGFHQRLKSYTKTIKAKFARNLNLQRQIQDKARFILLNACPVEFPPLGGTPSGGFNRACLFNWFNQCIILLRENGPKITLNPDFIGKPGTRERISSWIAHGTLGLATLISKSLGHHFPVTKNRSFFAS